MIQNGFQTYENINDAQIGVLKGLFGNGAIVSPRGQKTLESLCVGFSIQDPKNRLLTLKKRKWSLPMAIGEMCWHLSGSDEVGVIAHYASQWKQYSDDGERIFGSCYGRTVFSSSESGCSQWDSAKALLEADQSTRRAILFFNLSDNRFEPDAKDVSCTSSMQFLIRGGKLHAVVNMRSNDVVWGLPYDVFLFTALQEKMAIELGVDLGTYYHTAASMHLYERHFALAEDTIASSSLAPSGMAAMPETESIPDLLRFEKDLRTGVVGQVKADTLPPYWQEIAGILSWHHEAKVNSKYLSPASVGIQNPSYTALLDNLAA